MSMPRLLKLHYQLQQIRRTGLRPVPRDDLGGRNQSRRLLHPLLPPYRMEIAIRDAVQEMSQMTKVFPSWILVDSPQLCMPT
jgi:hypothetical protein